MFTSKKYIRANRYQPQISNKKQYNLLQGQELIIDIFHLFYNFFFFFNNEKYTIDFISYYIGPSIFFFHYFFFIIFTLVYRFYMF
jgi:hypothetical protein